MVSLTRITWLNWPDGPGYVSETAARAYRLLMNDVGVTQRYAEALVACLVVDEDDLRYAGRGRDRRVFLS